MWIGGLAGCRHAGDDPRHRRGRDHACWSPVGGKPLSDLLQDSDQEAIVDVVVPSDPVTAATEFYLDDRLTDTYQLTGRPSDTSEIQITRVDQDGILFMWGVRRRKGWHTVTCR